MYVSWLMTLLRKITWSTILGKFRYKCISYSQDGEDLAVLRLFRNKRSGFYIDVGAHHPYRFSNTCIFYQRGWRGINIDASPELIPTFNKMRKRDVNLCNLVSSNNEYLDFYIFADQVLNTTDKERALSVISEGNDSCKLKKIIRVESKSLEQILDERNDLPECIDFISIDCEWHDLEVLKSNNWTKYRPKVIIVEIHCDMIEILNNDVYKF